MYLFSKNICTDIFITKVDSILFLSVHLILFAKFFLKRNFRNMMPKHRFGSMFYEAIK